MAGDTIIPELDEAIEWFLSGDVNKGRAAFKQIVSLDPMQDEGWVWFIDSLASDTAREKALMLWLKMNPKSEIARGGLNVVLETKKKYEQIYLNKRQSVPKGEEIISHISQEEDASLNQPVIEEKLVEQPYHNGPRVNELHAEEIQVIQREPGKKAGKSSSNLWILLGASFLFMALSLTAIGYFLFRQYGWDLSSIFNPDAACTCENADAYMLRVADRVRLWRTNQSLLLNITEMTDITGNIELAQTIYQQEMTDHPPNCLKDVHALMLSLLKSHVDYALSLKAGDLASAESYQLEQQAKQSELQAEFTRLSTELNCTP